MKDSGGRTCLTGSKLEKLPVEVFSLGFDIGHAITNLPLADLPRRLLLSGAHCERRWEMWFEWNILRLEKAGNKQISDIIKKMLVLEMWLDRAKNRAKDLLVRGVTAASIWTF